MKRSKQGIAYEFLVRLTIAIVLVITAVVIAQRLFSISEEALTSFEGLSDKIAKLEPGDLRTHTLHMDETAAVIGFVQNSKELTFELKNGQQAKLLRPQACPDGKACLCLCQQEFDLTTETELGCKKSLICKNYPTINFPMRLQKADFISQNVPPDMDYSFYSGFIIRRSKLSGDILPGIHASRIALTIQRTGNEVRVCDHQPCAKKGAS